MKVKELLTDESKWTQSASARDIHGDIVPSRDARAVSWCLVGAIDKCYYNLDDNAKATKIIVDKIWSSIVLWNDQPHRTFEDVSNLIQELNI